jgi:hypothetical protein
MISKNEQLTGRLRYVDKTEFINDITAKHTHTLQQEYRCWNVQDPSKIWYIWRDVPSVKITELQNGTV